MNNEAEATVTTISLTANDVKEELGIDTVDTDIDSRLDRYIKVADAWLKGAIGEDYPKDDERAIELALLVIEDLYDRNTTNVKESNVLSRLKNDFIIQLQAERLLNGSIQSGNQDSETE